VALSAMVGLDSAEARAYASPILMSSLAPGLLVAAPPLGDPNFDRSVVLLAAHGEDGAFGWIINGREVMAVSELLVRAEVLTEPPDVAGAVRVGGPVSPEQVWLIYRSDQRFPEIAGALEVGSGVVACASRKALEVIADGRVPEGLFGLVGYAGWAPGQLENEIRVGAWLPTELDANLVFDVPRERLWQAAYEWAGTTPMAFTSRVGLA
jgi:putative transcriptional regulator